MADTVSPTLRAFELPRASGCSSEAGTRHLDGGQVRVLVRADHVPIHFGAVREVHFHLRLGAHHVGIRDDIPVTAVDNPGAEAVAGLDGHHARQDRLVDRFELILLVGGDGAARPTGAAGSGRSRCEVAGPVGTGAAELVGTRPLNDRPAW